MVVMLVGFLIGCRFLWFKCWLIDDMLILVGSSVGCRVKVVFMKLVKCVIVKG